MSQADLILRAKLTPPRPHRRLLPRPAVLARLREALEVRLTVVQAGTGYGKTTALAALASVAPCLIWYSAEEVDADPQRFLGYLIEGFRLSLPRWPDAPLALLQERRGAAGSAAWQAVLDAMLNALADSLEGPTLLVLDDFHFVAGAPEVGNLTERLIRYAPPDLHVVLATRHPLPYDEMVRWRARGEALELDRRALAFQPHEIEHLFRDTYGVQLSAQEVRLLAEKTEGWPIALQLVWQRLRAGGQPPLAELLARRTGLARGALRVSGPRGLRPPAARPGPLSERHRRPARVDPRRLRGGHRPARQRPPARSASCARPLHHRARRAAL